MVLENRIDAEPQVIIQAIFSRLDIAYFSQLVSNLMKGEGSVESHSAWRPLDS
jgi:hypothetical protein